MPEIAEVLMAQTWLQVLLGYIEHAKQIGMNAMYIWSCPPLAVRPIDLCCLARASTAACFASQLLNV